VNRAGPLVVVGDSLLDVDVDGETTRLCPDAPVPVVDVAARRHRPGGAALAAWLAAGDGIPVVLVTALGTDADAALLRRLLAPNVDVIALPVEGATVVKTRVLAGAAPLLRLDTGTARATAATSTTGAAFSAAVRALRCAGAVLVSDYGRGVSDLAELRAELRAVARRTPLVWDPHPRGLEPIPGCRLATPNAAEAEHFAQLADGSAGAVLATRWQADAVAVTVGAAGAVLTVREPGADRVRAIGPSAETSPGGTPLDSCGAGDRFASAAATALRDGADLAGAVQTAVDEATRFVRSGAAGSVARARPAERDVGDRHASAASDAYALAERVRRRGGRLVATGGCFDLLHVGHVELLHAARRLGDALVVCLNSDDSVRRAKGPSRPLVGQRDRARVLAALADVDAVLIFDEDTPAEALEALRPDVWVKGDDYVGRPLAEQPVVERHGGQVVLLPRAVGHSTSALVDNIREPASGPRSGAAADQSRLPLEVP
jgi:D-beta-D-heptose 7-phosphate kinase / D-beta-D-heptose 1-phosphate adenosyltransferase